MAKMRTNSKLEINKIYEIRTSKGVFKGKCVGVYGKIYGKFVLKLDGRSYEKIGKNEVVRKFKVRDIIVRDYVEFDAKPFFKRTKKRAVKKANVKAEAKLPVETATVVETETKVSE